MKYMGSKNRIANEILPIILRDRKPNQWYVEPFVGGANMIDKVKGNRIGSDINKYVISLLKEMQNGFDPPLFIDEDLFNDIKDNNFKYPDYLIGYVGTQMTFGAKWFGTFRRDPSGKRNYSKEARMNIIQQKKTINEILFYCCNYYELEIPNNSIIYCDPPYSNTADYIVKFNNDEFWDWCRLKCKDGHSIFISEYNAPPDFEPIWNKRVVSSLAINTGSKTETEKLFVHKSQLHLKPKSLFDFI